MIMKLNNIGETELINRISKQVRVDSTVLKGIGDDAAVIKYKRGKYLLFAADMILEKVHFNSNTMPFKIGWKALGVNISDIAAMGGIAKYAVLSLGLPKKTDIKFVDGLYSGVRAIAKKFNINIVGGDTNLSSRIVIDTAILGEAKKGELVLRSGARIGDAIALTGKLGGSIKGRHLSFMPRIFESQYLVKNFNINSMIDVSDGLSEDLDRICVSSKIGARVYESLIPLSKNTRSIKDALLGGEDFELLFTTPKKDIGNLVKKFKRKFKTPISIIGEITKDKSINLINKYGKASTLRKGGFRHF